MQILIYFQINLREFRIELWPGYETSIRNHRAGILLNCNVAHKVMRRETIYDIIMQCQRESPANFKNNFLQKVTGLTVLTSYLNKTYRILDVDFEKTPLSIFRRRNTEINILQYYKEVKYKY